MEPRQLLMQLVRAISNNKTLKVLSVYDDKLDKQSAMIIVLSLPHCNNTITKLQLPYRDYIQREVIKINTRRSKFNVEELVVKLLSL